MFIVNINYRNPHFHREIEINLILKGDVTVTTKNESYLLKRGSVCIFNSNQSHEIRASNSHAQILCLQISPKICADYFPKIFNLSFETFHIMQVTSKKNHDLLKTIIVELGYHYYRRKTGYEFSCMSLFNQLFKLFLKYLPYRIIPDEEKISNMAKMERLNRILNYIDENYMYKLTLSDIAKKEGLSESYLSHFIKDHLNQTFRDYLNNLRLNQAIKLITTSDMKLIDICAECGYSDNRYLYKAFRENFNCTPNEYRKRYSAITYRTYKISTESSENFYSVEKTIKILEELRGEVTAKYSFLL